MESYPRAAVERAMITWAQAGEITKPDISCAMKSGHFNLLTTEPETTEDRSERNGGSVRQEGLSARLLILTHDSLPRHRMGWNFCRSFIVLLSNRSGGILTMGIP